MVIRNPFDSPKITEKLVTIGNIVKIGAYTVSAIAIVSCAMYLNIKNEQRIELDQKVQFQTDKALKQQSGVVLDATAEIIKREGGLDLSLAKQYAVWIFDSAAKYAVDPMLILSVISIESKFNYKAISPTGPLGLMQIASSYHRDKATPAELFDPKKNIRVGTQILREYSDRSNTQIETLLRYNGSLGVESPIYATKVLQNKRKFENEVMKAVVAEI